MRTSRHVATAGLLILAASWMPRPVLAQAQGDRVAQGYLAAVASEYDVPRGEVEILAESSVRIEELPVLLRIADRSGIAPSAILAHRRGGATWLAIAGRYDHGAALFHLSIPPGQAGPLLERAVTAFAEAGSGGRDQVQLTDDEVVALENARVLAAALGRSHAEVLQARDESDSFVAAFGRLTGNP